ncbi:hypothetical protein PVL29_003087 [Vitis rotundifolia]|uniref:Pentatricopeptide repeat-containing protein n=1 Tax=Vitis rotundifolia TaxID=103349 RepID=A0AA39E4L0_VITRO|nr:hypothetical protein PVL29_003087 [Vitis rotundifolia]
MAVSKVKQILFTPLARKTLCLSLSSLPSDQNPTKTLISTAVSILRHQRSKSRWSHLQSLFPKGFSPTEASQIVLQIKNNPHLALSFFLWCHHKSLCNHTLLSYSTIIHILARARLKSQALGLIRTAIRVFDDSDECSSQPPKIFESLVKTYNSCGSAPFVFDLIEQSISIVKMLRSRGISPTISTCNALIWQVSRGRGCDAGYEVYREVFGSWDDEINEKVRVRVCPNVHTFNALMVCFYRDGGVEKVEEIWAEMGEWDCNPNAYSYSVLMAAFCDEVRMGEVEKLWEEMRIKKMEHDIVAYNTIIGGFCRIGEIERGEELFREMELSGIQSTCVTYEHLIKGYCEIGDVDSAVLLYKDMCRKGFRAEARTVDGMILLLCNNRRVHEALKLLRVAMGNVEFAPRGKSYESLIKGFCEEGKMEEALKLQSEMVGKGFKPTLEIYSAFIDGYMKQGNKEIAETLRKEMFETQMQQEEN